jgi:hypothetical protein
LVEPIERIIVGAEVVRCPALPTNGAVEHPTQRDTIDRSRMDAEPNDLTRVLIDLFRCESATLRTHWVLVIMDQMLQRLSFMWPRKVSQEGPPESCPGR